jgi:hypothetical protein
LVRGIAWLLNRREHAHLSAVDAYGDLPTISGIWAYHGEHPCGGQIGIAVAMFFTFPEDARWNADRQAVEFGVEIGEYHGVVPVPRGACSSGCRRRGLTRKRCVEAYYLQRTRLESIAERKGFARRQLTEDGNLEIRGGLRQLPIANVRRASPKPPQSTLSGSST